MRFLLGLVLGAATTFLLAGVFEAKPSGTQANAVDSKEQPLLAKAPALVPEDASSPLTREAAAPSAPRKQSEATTAGAEAKEDAEETLALEKRSKGAAREAVALAETEAAPNADPEAETKAETERKPTTLAATTDQPPFEPVPLRPNLPQGVPLQRDSSASVAERPESPAPQSAVPSAANAIAAAAASAEDASALEAMPASDEPATLSVWTPFHSEASATGFARRLTTQLGYPFTVTRTAPAKYHVVFSYANAAQRDLLLQQVAAVTGRATP